MILLAMVLMLTIGCNITKFNAYVKDLIDSLMAGGK